VSIPLQSAVLNRLLALMSPDDFALIAGDLAVVDLPRRFVMAEVDTPVEYAYFLNSGVGSIVASSPEGQQAEAGLFGRDGFSSTALVTGSAIGQCIVFMQIAGQGYRIPAKALLAAVAQSVSLRRLLLLYTQTLNTQTTFTALSNAVHHVEERLARWLLMCHDRSETDELALTHEFLSIMLAVRRPSVTTALHVLEGNHFIVSARGYVTIRNRNALEEFAMDAYGRPEREYLRLIGPMRAL
jgi:CRP-like cAMP-binding protein